MAQIVYPLQVVTVVASIVLVIGLVFVAGIGDPDLPPSFLLPDTFL